MTRGFGVRPSARQIERQRQANEACRRARAEYGVAWKPQVTCMARSCSAPIGRGMLFCKPHWLSLPVDMRRAIHISFRHRLAAEYGALLERARRWIELRGRA